LLFLTNEDPRSSAADTVRKCIQDSLFSAENLVTYINAIEAPNVPQTGDVGFAAVMKVNLATESNETSFDGVLSIIVLLIEDVTGFPSLLSLGLSALTQGSAKFSTEQRSILGASFLSTLDALSIPSPSAEPDVSQVVYLSTRHLQKLCSLLQAFLEFTPPSSDTLSTTLTSLATSCIPFLDFNHATVPVLAWNALALIMKVDFDVILLGSMQYLYPKLNHSTPEFLSVLVTTKFKMREGEEFLKMWTNLLWNLTPNSTPSSTIRHPELIKLYWF
jgi:hypothetical protein